MGRLDDKFIDVAVVQQSHQHDVAADHQHTDLPGQIVIQNDGLAYNKAQDVAEIGASGPQTQLPPFLFVVVLRVYYHQQMRPGPALEVAVHRHQHAQNCEGFSGDEGDKERHKYIEQGYEEESDEES